MLTAFAEGIGWRDVQVLHAADMHDAIAAAEKVTGCRVSHGVGGRGVDFHPGITVDAATGDVTRHHAAAARPQVVFGPPDVLAAIAAALRPPKGTR